MPLGRGAVPVVEIGTIVEALRQHLGSTHDYALHCPRAAPYIGVVACTYHHWFRPFSQHKRYCQQPVSGRRMQRFLQFRLGSHQLPIVLGRFAGGQHVARANRVCTHCGGVAVADELHMNFECPAVQAVSQRYAPLFSTDTNTMRSFVQSKIKCKVSSSFWTVLMSSTFDLCLLLYVIGLAGWLKHCSLSQAKGMAPAKVE